MATLDMPFMKAVENTCLGKSRFKDKVRFSSPIEHWDDITNRQTRLNSLIFGVDTAIILATRHPKTREFPPDKGEYSAKAIGRIMHPNAITIFVMANFPYRSLRVHQ